jgi:hypothetical protein
MANPLLKRLLGEATEDPVEHHLKTVGAGVPPPGRSYPQHGKGAILGAGGEEKREVQIGTRIKQLASDMGRNKVVLRDEAAINLLREIWDQGDALIKLHNQP